MVRRLLVVVMPLLLMLSGPVAAPAQQPEVPAPLYPGAAPRSIHPEPLPPIGGTPGPEARPAPSGGIAPPPAAPAAPAPPAADRVFCNQPVTIRVADRDGMPERYRGFVGI